MNIAKFISLLIILTLTSGFAVLAADGEQEPFFIKNFRLESGAVLPGAHVNYATFGKLNAKRDNAILLPSHYMANGSGYAPVIGADKALDPNKYFLIATELFGNGNSSSPSNTPEPFHGPRFPVPSIRDNVEAVHRLLLEKFGIRHLRAAVGFSMGGEQVLQLAVTYPGFADRIVATGATAKTYPTNYMMLESAITSLQTDPAFQGGDYADQPQNGMLALRTVMVPWIHAQEYWRQELWRPDYPAGATFKDVYAKSRTGLLRNADANNVVLQMRTWQLHDVGGSPGFDGDTERALRSIKDPVLYMPSETDLYFTIASARAEAALIPHATFKPIPSLLGHPGALAGGGNESSFLRENIRAFLEN